MTLRNAPAFWLTSGWRIPKVPSRTLLRSSREDRALRVHRGRAVAPGVRADPELTIDPYRRLPVDVDVNADKQSSVRELYAIGERELALEADEDRRRPLHRAASPLQAN